MVDRDRREPAAGRPRERGADRGRPPQGLERTGVGDAATASNNPPLYYLVAGGRVQGDARARDLLDRLARHADRVGADGRADDPVRLPVPARAAARAARSPGPPARSSRRSSRRSGSSRPASTTTRRCTSSPPRCSGRSRGCSAAASRRRTPRASALLVGVGALVKTQMLAFVPAVALAIALCAWRGGAPARASRGARSASRRARSCSRSSSTRVLGATVLDRPAVDRVGDVTASANPLARPWQLREQLSFGWQLYLPRLPFMDDLAPGVPLVDLWQKGLVGYFGWLDYEFPAWVYSVGAGAVWVVVGAAARRAPVAAPRRAPYARRRAAVYVLMAPRAGGGDRGRRLPLPRRQRRRAVRAGALPAAAAQPLRGRRRARRPRGAPRCARSPPSCCSSLRAGIRCSRS